MSVGKIVFKENQRVVRNIIFLQSEVKKVEKRIRVAKKYSLFTSIANFRLIRKLNKYRRTLADLEAYGLGINEYSNWRLLICSADEQKKYHQKKFYLTRIIDQLELLIETGDENIAFVIELAEEKLNQITGTSLEDYFNKPERFLSARNYISNEFKSEQQVEQEKYLKLLKRILGHALKSLRKFKGRDLRQQYRNIIRIIFKNMDDQSGDENRFFSPSNGRKFILSTVLNYNYGLSSNSRTYTTDS